VHVCVRMGGCVECVRVCVVRERVRSYHATLCDAVYSDVSRSFRRRTKGYRE
jgi:hypothetical protein